MEALGHDGTPETISNENAPCGPLVGLESAVPCGRSLPPPFDMYRVTEDGKVYSVKWGRPHQLSSGPCNRLGHQQVWLHANNIRFATLVHRIVAMAYLPPPENPRARQIAHLDGNPLNNHFSNLKWVTQRENDSHKHLHGTMVQGEAHSSCRLTVEAVHAIRASKDSNAVLGRKYGVSPTSIWKIKTGKSWKHVLPSPKGDQ